MIMPVTNLDAGVRFYAELLATPGFQVSSGRHYFNCGGVILAVYDAGADGDRRQPGHHAQSVYFAVSDLQAVFARAQQTGGLSTATGDGNLPMGQIAKRPWGEVSFYMHDPSGNPICFVDESSIYRGPRQGD